MACLLALNILRPPLMHCLKSEVSYVAIVTLYSRQRESVQPRPSVSALLSVPVARDGETHPKACARRRVGPPIAANLDAPLAQIQRTGSVDGRRPTRPVTQHVRTAVRSIASVVPTTDCGGTSQGTTTNQQKDRRKAPQNLWQGVQQRHLPGRMHERSRSRGDMAMGKGKGQVSGWLAVKGRADGQLFEWPGWDGDHQEALATQHGCAQPHCDPARRDDPR